MRGALITAGLAAITAALPAQATIYAYQISGNFGNNSGPNKKGYFVGVAKWDTTLNTNGSWFFWDIDLHSSTGTLLQSFKSADTFNTDTAGCFASDLASLGNGQTGTYAESAPAGIRCDGTNAPASSPALPAQSFLSIYTPIPYTWTPASTPVTAAYSYFRLRFATNGPGGTVDASNLQAVPANAQSAAHLGWSAMTNDTVDGTCSGTQAFPTGTQNCPYTGNTQNYQGISGVSPVIVTTFNEGTDPNPTPPDPIPPAPDPEVPAPLPLLGAGAAFGWTRRVRRRLLQTRR